MDNKNIILVALLAATGIFGACFFAASCGIIQKSQAVINCCANIKGIEYIVVAAFLGLLPAFFKAVHNDTHNRGAMKHS